MSSFQVDEKLLIQTLEDEVQNLQLSNIELKTKYKAAKTELKRNPSLRLETDNKWLEKKIEKCRTDLQRRRSFFENEKSKLEEQLNASNARIAELENEMECLMSEYASEKLNDREKFEKDLEDQKLAFDKLKSENETSSDQSTIHELQMKLRNSKWQILQLQSENRNCEVCKDLQNEKIKLEEELENHKLELNKLKTEHEAFCSQQPGGETSCQSSKKLEHTNRPQESTKKVISKHSKLSRSQSVRLVKERHNSLADCKSCGIANII